MTNQTHSPFGLWHSYPSKFLRALYEVKTEPRFVFFCFKCHGAEGCVFLVLEIPRSGAVGFIHGAVFFTERYGVLRRANRTCPCFFPRCMVMHLQGVASLCSLLNIAPVSYSFVLSIAPYSCPPGTYAAVLLVLEHDRHKVDRLTTRLHGSCKKYGAKSSQRWAAPSPTKTSGPEPQPAQPPPACSRGRAAHS